MSSYSVAEAKNNLSRLIDEALRGEGVVITRHGRPVVELKACRKPGKPVSAADLDWIAAHRVRPISRSEDAGSFVSRMRDEDER